MKPVIRALSHAAKDSATTGSDLLIYVAAHGDTTLNVYASITVQGQLKYSGVPLTKTQYYTNRFPVEVYLLPISASDLYAGTNLLVTLTATAGGQVSEQNLEIAVYPAVQATYTVTSSAELAAVLKTIKTSSYTHSKISFTSSATDYEFPSPTDPQRADFDLSTDATRLVDFEAATGVVRVRDVVPLVQRARWSRIEFVGVSKSICVTVTDGSVWSCSNCKFTKQGVATDSSGIVASISASYVKLDRCLLQNLVNGAIGIKVATGCTWNTISRCVFQDVPVIESNTGTGVTTAGTDSGYAIYTTDLSPVVRNNLTYGLSSTALQAVRGMTNGAVVGNVFRSIATTGFVFSGSTLSDNYIVNNTVVTHDSATSGFSTASVSTKSYNYVANNFFTAPPDEPGIWDSQNVWNYNAVQLGTSPGANSLSRVSPQFASDYGILKATSPLLQAGATQPNLSKALGYLNYQNQIGALPYTQDLSTTALFGVILNTTVAGNQVLLDGDSTDGFQAGARGGILDFSESDQSALLTLI